MTVQEIVAEVVEIQRIADSGDHETAHYREDKLHQDVLLDIATGISNPEVLAAAALRTDRIHFPRHCA